MESGAFRCHPGLVRKEGRHCVSVRQESAGQGAQDEPDDTGRARGPLT